MQMFDSMRHISSLSKTVKRKPLIFNFKWNFGWILGQDDILVLGDVPPPPPPPPPNPEKIFYPKLDLSWLMYLPLDLQNEMLIFGLHSTSDYQLSDLSIESQPKCKKGPLSHQKMKCSFLDYVQLLMIGQAIQATKVD